MLMIVITSQDLEQLCGCQKLLPSIITSQHHTHGCGVNVPQELVDFWDNVKVLCDFLCRHWDEALKQKEKSTKAFNLLASSKVKRCIETLHSAIAREGARQTATDDDRHRLEWEAKPEDVRLRSERAYLWKKIIAYDQDYPNDETAPSPGVEAYRALSKLLELTKEKGWVTDNGPGILMNESELAKLDRIFHKHRQAVRIYLMRHLWLYGYQEKAEIDQIVNGMQDRK